MKVIVLRRKPFSSVLKKEWPLYLFLAPAVAVTILFSYLPMFSNIIAFMALRHLGRVVGAAEQVRGLPELHHDLPWTTRASIPWYGARSIQRRASCYGQAGPFHPGAAHQRGAPREAQEDRPRRFSTSRISFPGHHCFAHLLFLTSDTQGLINNVRQMLGAQDRIIFMKDPLKHAVGNCDHRHRQGGRLGHHHLPGRDCRG